MGANFETAIFVKGHNTQHFFMDQCIPIPFRIPPLHIMLFHNVMVFVSAKGANSIYIAIYITHYVSLSHSVTLCVGNCSVNLEIIKEECRELDSLLSQSVCLSMDSSEIASM